MRFVHIYLICYFVLIVGAGLVLWQAGVLQRLSPITVVMGCIITVGLGALLGVTARDPRHVSRP